MRELAAQIVDQVYPSGASANLGDDLCMALSGLDKGEWDELEERRAALLGEFFSRKKQITIQPEGNGWAIRVPTAGLEIRTDNIEDGMHVMIQTLISYIALE
jgi:hypothetical protein